MRFASIHPNSLNFAPFRTRLDTMKNEMTPFLLRHIRVRATLFGLNSR